MYLDRRGDGRNPAGADKYDEDHGGNRFSCDWCGNVPCIDYDAVWFCTGRGKSENYNRENKFWRLTVRRTVKREKNFLKIISTHY